VIDKRVKTTAEAVAGVRDGSTVLVAGFGAVGVADNLLDALHEQGAGELTIVANNSGNGDYGLARLINSGRVRKVICSYPRSGDYSAFLNAYRAKSLELELLRKAPSASACVAMRRVLADFSRRFQRGQSWLRARKRAKSTAACMYSRSR